MAGALALLAALGACSDGGDPLAPTPAPEAPRQPLVVASVLCRGDRVARTLSCGKAELPRSMRGYILVGGQGLYVQLTSSNVSYDSGTGIFGFDVTVQNLIPQAMGTTDGSSADASGVRVLFASGPTVTGGAGSISVANPDGTNAYTAANQPYFQYSGAVNGADGILSTNETSGARSWQLSVDPGVTSFSFLLYVAAEVRYPNGWVDVTPGTPNLLAGNTQGLSATVRNAVGVVQVGAPVSWGSANGAVATVDGSGVVTGVSAGNTSITATSGVRSGAATLGVCPNLAVGEAFTAVMPLASSLCFGGAAGAEEFTYMPVNLSTSSALSLSVTGTGIQAVTGPPTPNRIPAGLAGLRIPSQELSIASDLPYLERDLPRLNGLLRSRAASLRQPGAARRMVTPNVVPAVGDLMNINTNSACSGNPSVRTGQVRSVSQHLIIVADTMNPAGGFTTAQYDSIALEFDTIAWPVDTANFGAPTDNDNNGHVVAFFTRAVNELTPPASSSYVLGFFASKDVFGSDPVDGCSNSNGQASVGSELFYMLVPDPTGAVNGNVRSVSMVRGNTTGTLGHEFQHMINGHRRAYITGASFFEQGFLNEGLSHVAEELMFYRASGMSPRQNVHRGTDAVGGVQLNSKRVAAYNAYAGQNLSRFAGWLQRPDTTGAFKNNANSLAVRGAIWGFLRYAADRVNGVDQSFWYTLVNSNLEGKANIQNAIGTNPDLWLRDFTAALYADDNAFTVASQYRTPSWNYRDLYALLYSGNYQLLARPLTNGSPLTLSYASGGGTAYTRFGVAASAFARVTALSGGVAPASPYQLIVLRTK